MMVATHLIAALTPWTAAVGSALTVGVACHHIHPAWGLLPEHSPTVNTKQ